MVSISAKGLMRIVIKRVSNIKFFEKIVASFVSSRNGVVWYYDDPERSKVVDFAKQIKLETDLTLLGYNEAYQISMAVRRTEKINGDLAEVGVYTGGSAKLISEAKGNRVLHLFDTFEGIPGANRIDISLRTNKNFYTGQYSATLESVKEYLKSYQGINFYKGCFPDTAEPVKDKKFSFVHLDVDVYKSTKDALEFFYPRMSKGGVIMSHDYLQAEGVRKAFDEFFEDKPEIIIEMSGTQCLVVKG